MQVPSQRPVPMLDLAALHGPLRDDLHAAFDRVLSAERYILGPEVAAFEDQVAEVLQAPHALGVSSGSDALVIALRALDIGPGDEVVTSPFTFFATAGAIARVGARPVFADIEPDSFNLCPRAAERAITPQTKALIPVHLFGKPANLHALTELCTSRGLALIEDAAQSMGATYNGRPVGTTGAFGCFSTFPAKNLGGFGDGGLLTCCDPALAQKARMLRVHGGQQRYHHALVGGNFRLDALQAALLQVKLPLLARHNRQRRTHARLYSSLFTAANLDQAFLTWPDTDDPGHVFNQYTVQVADRDGLATFLRDVQIDSAIYYPLPLHRQPCFLHLGYAAGSLPVAEAASRRVLSIPVHPTLDATDVQRVANAIIDWCGRQA